MESANGRTSAKKLWYRQPAEQWEEALPIGNGRLGAMIFGGTDKERLQLNEDTLWSGFPRDTNNYEAIRHLQRSRELLAEGKYAEAERLIGERMVGVGTESYQPLGDLLIEQNWGSETADVSSYRRELDLETGVATVVFATDKGKYRREAWTSAVDGILAMRRAAVACRVADVAASAFDACRCGCSPRR
jgi:hypothetical protein